MQLTEIDNENEAVVDSFSIQISDAVYPGELSICCDTTISEADGGVSFVVTRTGGSDGVVDYTGATVSGTAAAADDYLSTNFSGGFLDGQSGDSLWNVTVFNDSDYEGAEYFDIILTGVTGGATVGNDSIRVTILDDDPPPVSIDTFVSSSYQIVQGDSVTISWSTSNADSCSASGGAGGWAGSSISLPGGSTPITINDAGTYTFSLDCMNESSSDSDSLQIEVTTACEPFLTLWCPGTDAQSFIDGCTVQINGAVSSECGPTPINWNWDDGSSEQSFFPASHDYADSGNYTVTVTAGEFSEQCAINISDCNAVQPVEITAFSATPSSIESGQSTTISWSVVNAETCTATGGTGGWAGSSISSSGGSRSVTISSAGSYTFTLSCSNSTSSDSESVIVTVDDETQPDLRADNVSVSRTTVEPGASLTVSTVVRNVGGADAAASTVRYYLSTDTQIGPGDQQLGTDISPALAAGGNTTLSRQVTISADDGAYTVGVCVDTIPNEISESNNCSVGPRITVESDNQVVCTSRALRCDEFLSGELSAADCTDGPRGPGFYAEKFTYGGSVGDRLFFDATWASSLDGYLLLKGPDGLTVAQNDNDTSQRDSHIEYEITRNGTYTLWATSFAAGATGSFDVSLVCDSPSGPDLLVAAPTIDTTELVPGQRMVVSTRLDNLGNVASDSTTLRYRLSSNAVIDSRDSQLGSDGAGGLGAGSGVAASLAVLAPSTPGSYYVGVCADSVPNESSVSNNCSAGTRITVSQKPSCTRSNLACSQLVSGSLSVQDCTDGPRGTGYFAERFDIGVGSGRELVFEADWQGIDGYLVLTDPSGRVVAENDDGGAGSRIEFKSTGNGVYRLWATSYQRNSSGSFNLEMECGEALAPDLVASAVALDASRVGVGDPIQIDSTVWNDGTVGANATTVRFMLSSNPTITVFDQVLGSEAVPGLGAGGRISLPLSINAPDVPGNYWLGICVDAVAGETLTGNNCSQLSVAPQVRVESDQSPARPQSAHNQNGTLLVVSAGNTCRSLELACGGTVSGDLAADDCDSSPRGAGYVSESVTFNGSQGDIVSLDIAWNEVDGYLYLEGPQGEIVEENDDFGNKGQSRLEVQLPSSGQYTAWPTAFIEGAGGSYQLSLECNQPKAPDLDVEAPQLSASTIRWGQKLGISTRARNSGGFTSSPTTVEYILAAGPELTGDDRVLGSSDVPPLESSAGSDESAEVTVTATPGTYYIGTCVNQDPLELDVADNCQVSGPVTIEATGEPIPISNALNDAWYNPDTSGQGFFINVFPDTNSVFLSWFTFDTDRPPTGVPFQLGDPGHRWLTGQGTFDLGVAELDIYLSRGGVFDSGEPAVGPPTVVGSMTVTFFDCNNGLIDFDLSDFGEKGVVPITRVSPENIAACEESLGGLVTASTRAGLESRSGVEADGSKGRIEAEGDTGSGFAYNPLLNDAWFNPETNGQGFFFNIFPDSSAVFLSWFTYELSRPAGETPFNLGEPGHRWLTAQGSYEGDTAEMQIFETMGGIFNEGGLPPENTTAIGRLTATFQDCNAGLISYELDSVGRQSEVPIQRTARDAIPACEEAQPGDDSDDIDEPTEGVTPSGKATVENLCGESVDWYFDWPDVEGASHYWFRLLRNDSTGDQTRFTDYGVPNSQYAYEGKEPKIGPERLDGWTWQYRPVFLFGASKSTRPGWSKPFTFRVKPEEDPCVD